MIRDTVLFIVACHINAFTIDCYREIEREKKNEAFSMSYQRIFHYSVQELCIHFSFIRFMPCVLYCDKEKKVNIARRQHN